MATCYIERMKKKKKLLPKDKLLLQWLKQGGREGAKQDFIGLVIQSVKSSKKQ